MALIDFDICCAKCGSSLRGADVGGTCAHCSAPVEHSLATSAIDAETMRVSRSVPCIGCEYDLRTLYVGGVCPECGCFLRESLSSNTRLVDAPWWQRAESGVRLVWVGGLGTVFTVLGAGIACILSAIACGVVMDLPPLLGFGSLLVFVPVLVGGILLVAGAEDPKSLPSLLAYLLPLTLLTLIGCGVWAASCVVGGRSLVVASAVFDMAFVGTWISLASFGICLRRIARRACNASLERLTTAGIGAFVGGAGLHALVLLMASWMGQTRLNGTLLVAGNIILLGACPLWLVIIGRYRRMLNRIHEARGVKA